MPVTGPTVRRPAVPGWFTVGDDGEPPALIGTRCSSSGTYFFPPERVMSRAPGHADGELHEVRLSTRGRLWSYTNAGYRPPEPYVPVTDPHVPFAIAAVELAEEGLVVLGQVVAGVGVEDLTVGMEMELVIDTLFTDTDPDTGEVVEHLVWKWQPAAATGEGAGATASTDGGTH